MHGRVAAAALALAAGPLQAQTPPGTEAAVAVLRAAAEAGDPRARVCCGSVFEFGDLGGCDSAAAIRWSEAAAAQGLGPAHCRLGSIHRRPVPGEEPDPEAARAYLGQGAALGLPRAMAGYGDRLLHGLGGPADLEQGVAYLRASMADGCARAGSNLAETIAVRPAPDPRPLAAAAHCLWATSRAGWQDGDGTGWRRMGALADPLTGDERKQADELARTLVAP